MSCAKRIYVIAIAIVAVVFQGNSAKADDVYTEDRWDGGVVDITPNGIWDTVEFLVQYEDLEPAFSLVNNTYRSIRVGIYSPTNDAWSFFYLDPYDTWSHYSFDDEPDLVQLFVWNAAKQKWVGKDSAIFGLDVSNKYEAYKYAKRDYRLRMRFILR